MSEQEKLRRRIDAVSFAMWELHLFLDSHPNCIEAAKQYDRYRSDYSRLKAEYAEKYGNIYDSADCTSRWQWINSPWPWEVDE